MNAQDKAEARAAIERAGKLTSNITKGSWGISDERESPLYSNQEKFSYDLLRIETGGDGEQYIEFTNPKDGEFITQSRQLVPELAAHLKTALARIDELEQVNQHLTAQLVAMNDYYGNPENEE